MLLYYDAVLTVTFNFPLCQIEGGKGTVTLKRAHITNSFPNIQELVGGYIFVAATVLTGDGKKAQWKKAKFIPVVHKKTSYKVIFYSICTLCVSNYLSRVFGGTWSTGWNVYVCVLRW